MYQQKKTLATKGCEEQFRTKLQLARTQLETLIQLAFPILQFLLAQGIDFVSCIKKNQNIKLYGEWVPAETMLELLPMSAFRPVVVKVARRSRRTLHYRTFWVDEATVPVRGLGEMRLVLSKKTRDDTTGVILITNRLDWSAEEISHFYSLRWRIETFCRDAKQNLHLGDYFERSLRGAIRHHYLVFCAYSLLEWMSCMGIWQRILKGEARTIGILRRMFQWRCLEGLMRSVVQMATMGAS